MAGSVEPKLWPGDSDKAYPEIFTAPPPNYAPSKPGQLSVQQVKQFFEEGYVVVENFFDHGLLESVKKDVEMLVDRLATRLYDGGKIKSLYKDAGVFSRLTLIDKEFPGANILLHKGGWLPPTFRELWSEDKLLNVVEQLLGTQDINGSPVWNLRCKTPKTEAATVPWHQDAGYMDKDSYNVLQVTGWIPLLDTNEINGCLQMMRGGHRSGKVATHQCCSGDTWYIMLEEEEMRRSLNIDPEKDMVTLPVPYGGMLLFNNLIPHRSLSNFSDAVRWSLDLRWQKISDPIGFYNLKDGIQLRSSNPDFKIDWTEFNALDRTKLQAQSLDIKEDEFDTTISGPWMKKWEMVHTNRHTDKLHEDEKSGAEVHAP